MMMLSTGGGIRKISTTTVEELLICACMRPLPLSDVLRKTILAMTDVVRKREPVAGHRLSLLTTVTTVVCSSSLSLVLVSCPSLSNNFLLSVSLLLLYLSQDCWRCHHSGRPSHRRLALSRLCSCLFLYFFDAESIASSLIRR